MSYFDDEIKRILDEIRKLREEIRNIKELSEKRETTIGGLIDEILAKIPYIVEKELNKVLGFGLGRFRRRHGRVFVIKPGKIFKIELEEILSDIDEDSFFEKYEDLIKKIDPAEVSDALVTLANPDRIKILQSLYERDRYFSELEENLRLGPSSLRHHLSKLMNGGLITQERSRGKYSITNKGIAALILLSYLYEKILK